MEEETIAAIATPLGEGALAIVRLSGPEAILVADRCFRPAGRNAVRPTSASSHTIHYGHVIRDGSVVDEVMLSILHRPRTFTREDMVEINCHGGLLATQLVLEAVLAAGARPAHPGEFTKRAFLNGRLDLAQAEAVSDLIRAKTELALGAAHEQLSGKLSQRINQLRDDWMHVLAHVEAHIDFPDEDITPESHAQLLERLARGLRDVEALLRHAREGQILRDGVRAAIVGRPNAGKSCLLNCLLGHDRAIVSPIAGTTRDTIEETANIRGLPVRFIDTAGLRESVEAIEAEGIRRSRQSLEKAEVVLHVFDGSESWTPEDDQFLGMWSGKKGVLIRNKADLPQRCLFPSDVPGPLVDVSCLTGAGIEELKETIKDLLWSGTVASEMLEIMISSRHREALERGRAAVERASESLKTFENLELAAADLRIGTGAVGEIVGKTSTEDLLDSIFSQFCIGK